MIENAFETLERQILALLNAENCMSEYDLIKALQRQGAAGFPDEPLTHSLSLFRMHFLLFHLLYRLRQHLSQTAQATLDIQPLKICLLPYVAGQYAIVEADPVEQYYKDFNHWRTTTEDNIKARLAHFWALLATRSKREEALKILGLKDPVNDTEIKQKYRQLAMQQHPDQGGDTAAMQRLNQAMTILKKSQLN